MTGCDIKPGKPLNVIHGTVLTRKYLPASRVHPRCANTHNYLLCDFYYKYCSIKSTGLINCTGFLLRVLVLGFLKVLTAKSTVSIKSTGLINCTGILLCSLYFSLSKSNLIDIFLIFSKILALTLFVGVIWTFFPKWTEREEWFYYGTFILCTGFLLRVLV